MRCFKRYFLTVLLLLCLPVIGWASQEQPTSDAMDYKQLEKRIANLSVKNMEGKDVALDSLWEQKRVVLVFVRHFG
jgi:cytochrome oxidase Cu insertion factor (SCO1/SenC/PrrC family)